ncbi:2Fe-2S iron-sulfur cluster binding domain-containing protein [Streptomyces sp. ISL-98]|nr:2Fe-2S iron-sulfur cluster binding domain-containing protein [Streptomyces sp. ISL-98]
MTGMGAATGTGDPLAAPGHDYVPPQITVAPGAATDPGATGTWMAPPVHGEMRWPEAEGSQPPAQAPAHDPGATGQWSFEAAEEPTPARAPVPAQAQAPAAELTGQWTIPVADGDLPDESGEFTTSALAAAQWGAAPPATLPGGATAPWASTANTADAGATLPGGATAPWATASNDAEPEPEPEPESEPEAAPEATTEPGQEPEQGQGQEREQDPEPDPVSDSAAAHSEHPHASYVLRVNGADRPVTDAWIGESLLYVLRERLGLAGAKDGCSQGECGACAVQVDGRLVASCLVPAATTAGSEVRTVEGLATDGEPSDVQRALANCGAVQCGFCVPGMAMTVHDLLEGNHAPSDLEARQALCGNLCRCSGYRGVLEAVREVVAEREASAAPAAAAPEEVARIPHQAPPGAGSVQQPHPHDGGMA